MVEVADYWAQGNNAWWVTGAITYAPPMDWDRLDRIQQIGIWPRNGCG